MNFAQQVAATLLAKQACRTDDAETFSKALAAGADLFTLFTPDLHGSVWDTVVISNASKCFAMILPHVNVISGPKAEQVRDIVAQGSLAAPSAGILLIAAPTGASRAMAEAARAEIFRQEGQSHVFEAMAIGAVAPLSPSEPARRRSAL